VPRRTRTERARIADSKNVAKLLKLLNHVAPFNDRKWDAFRHDRIEDLDYIRRGEYSTDPPADRDVSQLIMGVRVPASRLNDAVTVVSRSQFADDRDVRDAFACRAAISEIFRASRELRQTDLISRCVCGTFLFRQKHCDERCEAKAGRRRSTLSRQSNTRVG
jgi:hypothetical protein